MIIIDVAIYVAVLQKVGSGRRIHASRGRKSDRHTRSQDVAGVKFVVAPSAKDSPPHTLRLTERKRLLQTS